ncbi:MAG: NADH:ubiquinone reductase (Na(+)-transporting) subunit D [Spirochaetales bacterium]|nr:NADH:ubiquinone reductase (Na(+)-transporting) subunit D [Spirochaetales bacterium]
MRNTVPLFKRKWFTIFLDGLWDNNAIFGMVLGMCSSLAVTTTAINASVMALSVTAVLVISSFLLSCIRKFIPDQVRMVVFMLVISTFVITVDFVLRITVPDISRALGPYVGLIITNCILMGRAEAFAIKNPPLLSIMDALGSGLGYGGVIILIAVAREFLSTGSFFGAMLIPGWPAWGLAAIAPGAFFVLAGFTMLFNWVRGRLKNKTS